MQNVLWTSMWAVFASLFCALLSNAGAKDGIVAAVIGGLGWFLYRFLYAYFGYAEPLGYMCGAFAIALFSEIAAYVAKNPATVYMLPALFPLVPGYGLFATMRAAVIGEADQAAALAYGTILSAGAIALGVAVASSAPRLLSRMFKPQNQQIT